MTTIDPESRDEAVEFTDEEDLVSSFAEQLADAFGIDATVETDRASDGTLEVVLDGDGVGRPRRDDARGD